MHGVHSFLLFLFIQPFSPPGSFSFSSSIADSGSLTSLKNLCFRPNCSEYLLWKASSTELVDVCCEWCWDLLQPISHCRSSQVGPLTPWLLSATPLNGMFGSFHNTDHRGFPSLFSIKLALWRYSQKSFIWMDAPQNFFHTPRNYKRPPYETLSLTLRLTTGLIQGPSFYLFEHLLQFSYSYLGISVTRRSSRHSSLCSLTCNLRWSNRFAATLGRCKF